MRETSDRVMTRTCLVPPLPEHEEAARLLSEAADAILAGEVVRAEGLVKRADMPVLREHTAAVMGGRHPLLGRRRPVSRSAEKAIRLPDRMPSGKMAASIFARDGWICRFCGCRVVSPNARRIMRSRLPGVIDWSEAEGFHAAFYALSASLDHVVPHSAGGTNEEENLVGACWSCQFGRGHYLLEEFDLSDPRHRTPVPDDWDGLTRLLRHPVPRATAKEHRTPRIPATRRSVSGAEDWYASMDRHHPGAARRLIDFVEGCSDLGVTWSLNKVLLIRLMKGSETLYVVGVTPEGLCEVPWHIGGAKNSFRVFAETLAAGIPDAIFDETPRTWTVTKPRKKRLEVLELLDAAPVLREALARLKSGLEAEFASG